MLIGMKKYKVPLRIGNLLFMSLFLCVTVKVFWGIIFIRPVSVLHFVIGAALVILCVGWLRSCVHYTFTNEFLVSNFLGVPFRKIRWEKIGHAMYVHAWKDIVPKYSAVFGGVMPVMGNSYGQMIYVTLKGCPRFIPSYHIRLLHSIIHPLHTACIWLPDSAKYHYIDIFRQVYPDLEMQPIDAWKRM